MTARTRSWHMLSLLLACHAPGPALPADDAGRVDTAADTAPDTAPDPAADPWDCGPDHAALTAGVATLDQGGSLPSLLIVHGDRACPVVLDEQDRPFVAVATHGAGRVLHAGHEGLVTAPMDQGGDAAAFFLNALRWAGRAEQPRVGVEAGLGPLSDWLEGQGFAVSRADVDGLDEVDVYVATSYTERDDAGHAALRDWVAAGGGLLQGGHAWYWAYDHENVAEDYPGNRVLNPMGITVTAATVDAGTDTVSAEAPSPLFHAGRALEAVEAHLDGSAPLSTRDQRRAAGTVGLAVQHLPFSFADWFGRVRAVLDAAPAVVPSVAAPVVPDDAPIEALVVTIWSRLAGELPAEEVPPVPSAFPGEVPTTSPRVRRSVTVDATAAGRDPDYGYAGAGEPTWRGTGLYAPPGEVVTVTVPAAWAGAGLSVQIGAHTDRLWDLESWARHPEITRAWTLDAAETRIASGFGGPIYVRVPGGSTLGMGEVTVDGAVEYARFVAGETLPDTFRAQLAAAPLAEFESDRFVLTVPAAEVPATTDPEALTAFWDAILDADADLAALPRERERAERLAVDVQISAGWMHSGYPIMAYQYTAVLADDAHLAAEGDWGAFHELGHNHQFGPLNLPGTTECTVNLWSVYAFETVLGIDRADAHPAVTDPSRADAIAAYVAGGRDFSADWHTWTCLETYLQLQEAFGWEFYRSLHATYLAMPTAERPATDQARIDRWVVESSFEAGLDLTDFYAAWGLPMSAAALDAVAGLPPWTDHPMAGAAR